MSLPVYNSWEEKSKYFNHFIVNSFEELDGLISVFTPKSYTKIICGKEFSREIRYLFRGVNSSSFRMFSSIQRCLDYRYNDYNQKISLPTLMNEVISRFYNDNNGFLRDQYMAQIPQGSLCTHPSIWAFIQHFGGPSPLLDFTSDVESALFFAFNKANVRMSGNPTHNEMSEYVSLFIYPDNPMRTGEVTNMWTTESERAALLVAEQELTDGRSVDTDHFVCDVHIQKLEQTCWGSMLYGNEKSRHSFTVPDADNSEVMTAVDNINISAQMGCFFQGDIQGMRSLEESPIILNAGGYEKYGTCIEIHKSLLDEIQREYKIPNESEVYPEKNGQLKPLYEAMQSLWNPKWTAN